MCLLHFPCLAGTKHVGFELQIYENPAKKRISPQEDASVTSPMSGSELEVVAYQDEEAAVVQLHVGILRQVVETHVVAHSGKEVFEEFDARTEAHAEFGALDVGVGSEGIGLNRGVARLGFGGAAQSERIVEARGRDNRNLSEMFQW